MLRLLQAAVLLWHLVFLSCSGVLRLSSVKKYNDNQSLRTICTYIQMYLHSRVRF